MSSMLMGENGRPDDWTLCLDGPFEPAFTSGSGTEYDLFLPVWRFQQAVGIEVLRCSQWCNFGQSDCRRCFRLRRFTRLLQRWWH
jgi:hypothetical protein